MVKKHRIKIEFSKKLIQFKKFEIRKGKKRIRIWKREKLVTGDRFHERSSDFTEHPSNDEGKSEETAISDPCGTTADAWNDGRASVACAGSAAWR